MVQGKTMVNHGTRKTMVKARYRRKQWGLQCLGNSAPAPIQTSTADGHQGHMHITILLQEHRHAMSYNATQCNIMQH